MSVVEPSIRDHPDWMIPGGAGSLALIDDTIADTTVWTSDVLDVSSWPVLQVSLEYLSGPAGAYDFTIEWFASSQVGAGHQLCIKTLRYNVGDDIKVSFPNFGPSVRFTISPPAVAAWSVFLFVNARHGDDVASAHRYGPIITTTQALAAGGVATVNVPNIRRGVGMLFLACSGGLAANVQMQQLNVAGAYAIIAAVDIPGGQFTGAMMVALPAARTQLVLVNRGAALQTLVATLSLM